MRRLLFFVSLFIYVQDQAIAANIRAFLAYKGAHARDLLSSTHLSQHDWPDQRRVGDVLLQQTPDDALLQSHRGPARADNKTTQAAPQEASAFFLQEERAPPPAGAQSFIMWAFRSFCGALDSFLPQVTPYNPGMTHGVALVHDDDVQHLISSLEIKHYYQIAWAAAYLFVLLLTAIYAVQAGRATVFQTVLGKTDALADLDRPFEGIPTEDGQPLQLVQKGYVCSAFGQCLLYMWALLPVTGYMQMISFCLDEYLYALHTPDQTWTELAEAFLLVFIVSHVVLFINAAYSAWARVFFMTQVPLSQATRVLVQDPGAGTSKDILCEVEIMPMADGSQLRYLEFTCVRYLWSDSKGVFLPTGVEDVSGAEASSRIKEGGFSGAELKVASTAGPNVIHVTVPSFPQSIIGEFLSPIYIFQFGCIWVYMFFSTWNIAFIWLALAVVSGTSRAVLIRRNQLQIQRMARTESEATVLRDGQWKTMGSCEVMPGDVVSITEGVACCDIAIVEGGVVVNESMLTGEPMPVQRFAVEANNAILDPHRMKRNFVFAGSIVMQSAGGHTEPTGQAVGIVVSTGARTAKGALVRMVLFPSEIKFAFTEDMLRLYMLMLFWVIFLSSLSFSFDMGHWTVTVYTALCILTQSLNPNLPVSLTLAQTVAASRLGSHCEVKCLNPSRIPIAGKLHVMVLDKTGTITKDGMEFAGLRAVDLGKQEFMPLMRQTLETKWTQTTNLPGPVLWSLAACHTVTMMADGTLVGNMVEVAMFKCSGFYLSKDARSAMDPGTGITVKILKKLEFDHQRMTSGVVVRVRASEGLAATARGGSDKILVLMKGSYERIGGLVDPNKGLPQDFHAVTEQYASEQYYVLGLGVKELSGPLANESGLASLRRDDLEQGLSFSGLLLFRNEIKNDSPQALEILKAGQIRCVMCTGDNALTGAAIGWRCSMLKEDPEGLHKCVILGSADGGALEWKVLPSGATVAHSEVLSSDPEHVDLVLTRTAFHVLQQTDEIHLLLDRVRIYARMKPEDKVAVINLHQSRGWMVGMCGDGGNDCGALRAAHVGLALSDAEASIVAPFSSGAKHGTEDKSLMSLVQLVIYGRAALATNNATLMYFMVYAFCLPSWKLVLMGDGNKIMSEWDYIFIDIAVGSVMVAFMTLSWPAESMARIRPTARVLGPRAPTIVLTSAVIFVLHVAVGTFLVRREPFYLPYDAMKLGIPAHSWQFKSDSYDVPITFLLMSTQYATCCFAFSYGAEFRRSVWRNSWLTITYLAIMLFAFIMLWSGPNSLNCIFRVNCDCKTSQQMYVPIIQELSTGSVGGCFLGPQILHYKATLGKDFQFPDKSANDCRPHVSVDPLQDIVVESEAFAFGGWLGESQCRGPNNCYSGHFRKVMSLLLLSQAIITNLFAKLMSMWHPAPKVHFGQL
mmetsp:Transcript_165532/g.293146  ORF Transcript_165532/g.293146 Transcript_165532/m.293146 type:complete len:1415 (+) Transcript_165532:148-4392(+)